jgi:hypothetical protein
MNADPRLRDVSLLTLAAMRAQHRRHASGGQAQDWLHTEGLHPLLQAATVAETHDATDREPPGRRAGASSMARLLAEARRYRQEGDYGAV